METKSNYSVIAGFVIGVMIMIPTVAMWNIHPILAVFLMVFLLIGGLIASMAYGQECTNTAFRLKTAAQDFFTAFSVILQDKLSALQEMKVILTMAIFCVWLLVTIFALPQTEGPVMMDIAKILGIALVLTLFSMFVLLKGFGEDSGP